MTKRTTLMHRLPNGTIATRQTTAAYTHVVVCRLVDVDGYRAAELAWARRWFRDFADRDARIAAHAADIEEKLVAFRNWGVDSWHRSFEAAKKAAAAEAGDRFFAYAVEAVNGAE
jgi:hypothetical protein